MFRKDYQEIIIDISQISITELICILIMGMGYILLDAMSCFIMMIFLFPNFKFMQAMTVTLLGVFANISTSFTGTIPMQSYYLYRWGIEVGTGIAAMILECVFHKISVFIYAIFMIASHIRWLKDTIPEIMKYIYLGSAISAIIILALLLLCTWGKIQKLLFIIIQKLPNTKKWNERKNSWTRNLESLYSESQRILKNQKCCCYVILSHLLKLCWVYTTPFICMRILGCTLLSFEETQILSSIMFLIIGILPNIAGIGPTEAAFLILFSPYIGYGTASLALVLYRLANYCYPFIISIFVFVKEKNNLIDNLQ